MKLDVQNLIGGALVTDMSSVAHPLLARLLGRLAKPTGDYLDGAGN